MASIYPNRKEGKIVSFKFKIFLGREDNGRQIVKCTTWTPPSKSMAESKLVAQAEKQAILWEQRAIAEYNASKLVKVSTLISFEDFVNRIWFPNQMNEKEHRASTIAFHNYILKVVLLHLGDKQLQKITTKDIENYLNYLKNTYRTAQNKSLSPKTIRHHYATMNLIFEYAVKIDYIIINPLAKISTPKLQKRKVDALTKGETLILVQEIEKLPVKQRLMYFLLLTTGIRRGECFGLQWGDIDFDLRTLSIQRSVTYTSQSGIVIGLPKTDTGIREIPITDSVVNLLQVYKREESKEQKIRDNAFLFHSKSSYYVPHQPMYLTKHMKRFMKKIGLPDMSPHDLRHTCASLNVNFYA